MRRDALRLDRFPRPIRWIILAVLTLVFTSLLTWIHLPAALMLGPMVAAIIVENAHGKIQLPKLPFFCAQGVIGVLVAAALTQPILDQSVRQWPIFLTVILAIIFFNSALGWLLSRWGILPGTTAIWGLLPGAASAMMIMAEAYGADSRLVGFMQYVRVVMIATVASLIATYWVHGASGPVAVIWFPSLHVVSLIETLIILFAGVALGHVSRVPGAMIMVPLILGATLHVSGLVDVEMPRWLLALGYLAIGWRIGLRFTRDVLSYAAAVLPQIILSIFTVMIFCAIISLALTKFLGVDPLTAYLATSPGGLDAAVIIAASTKVDMGFVLALQTGRFLIVLLIGPSISRFVADRVGQRAVKV